jgi:protein-arginine kinase
MSVIKEYDLSLVNDLMVKIQWSHLQEYFGIRFKSIVDSDDYRAYMIRSELTKGGDRNV